MGSHRVGHYWSDLAHTHTKTHKHALGVEGRRYSTKLFQTLHSPQSQNTPALLILICIQYYCFLYAVHQLTDVEKRNPMAAGHPAGLLLSQILLLCEAEKGALPWSRCSLYLGGRAGVSSPPPFSWTSGAHYLTWLPPHHRSWSTWLAFPNPPWTWEANEVPAGTWKSHDCSRVDIGTFSSVVCFQGGTVWQRICPQWRRLKRVRFHPWVGKIPWGRKWQPTPLVCLSLVGCSPRVSKSQTQLNTQETLKVAGHCVWEQTFQPSHCPQIWDH